VAECSLLAEGPGLPPRRPREVPLCRVAPVAAPWPVTKCRARRRVARGRPARRSGCPSPDGSGPPARRPVTPCRWPRGRPRCRWLRSPPGRDPVHPVAGWLGAPPRVARSCPSPNGSEPFRTESPELSFAGGRRISSTTEWLESFPFTNSLRLPFSQWSRAFSKPVAWGFPLAEWLRVSPLPCYRSRW
jgi:hypothetical protein